MDKIKSELLKYLDSHKLRTPVTEGIVDQYIDLCAVADRLFEQIESEGVTLEGPSGIKKNPAVSELPRIAKQASDLLMRLGYTPERISKDDEGDEEL